MERTDSGVPLHALKRRIRDAQEELTRLASEQGSMPELVDSANLLRANERLVRENGARAKMIRAYDSYSGILESTLTSLLDIQKDLTAILKMQSSLIGQRGS